MFLQVSPDTHQGATRAEPGDEVGDLRAVAQDFWSGGFVVRTWVGFVAVLMQEAPLRMIGCERFRTTHRTIGTFRPWREDDFRTEHFEHLTALDRHTLGHEDGDRVAGDARNCRQRNPCVARRRFENSLTLHESPGCIRALDHRVGDAVLHRAEGILTLELGKQSHGRTRRQLAHLHQRCVADEFEHARVRPLRNVHCVDVGHVVLQGVNCVGNTPSRKGEIPIGVVNNLSATPKDVRVGPSVSSHTYEAAPTP